MGKKKLKTKKALRLSYGRDPSSGVVVALDHQDRGTEEMRGKIVAALVEFTDRKELLRAFKAQEVSVGGRIQYANRPRDGLDVLFEGHSISDVEYIAAREFNQVFTLANEVRAGCVSIECAGTSGGGMGMEDWLQRRIMASQKVETMLSFAGEGQGDVMSLPALAVQRVAGNLWSLRRMSQVYLENTHFWRGTLRAGLQSIANNYLQGRRKPRLRG